MNIILNKPIHQTELREDLKAVFIKYDLLTLNDVLKLKSSELLKLDGFNYRQLKALMDFLYEHNLEDLIKD